MIVYLALALGAAGAVMVVLLVSRREGGRMPLAGVSRFAAAGRRSALVSAGLAAATAAAAASAGMSAPRQAERPLHLAPGTAMVVIDLSGSIDNQDYTVIATVLRALAASAPDRHAGLVFFADEAAEVLPPQTPARELDQFARFLGSNPKGILPTQVQSQKILHQLFLRQNATNSTALNPAWLKYLQPAAGNPWEGAVGGGTSISTGLAAARQALQSAGVNGGEIVLISDLMDGEDSAVLESELLREARDGYKLRVVPLPAPTDGTADYKYVFGQSVVLAKPQLLSRPVKDSPGPGPTPAETPVLIALALLFACLAGWQFWNASPTLTSEVES